MPSIEIHGVRDRELAMAKYRLIRDHVRNLTCSEPIEIVICSDKFELPPEYNGEEVVRVRSTRGDHEHEVHKILQALLPLKSTVKVIASYQA